MLRNIFWPSIHKVTFLLLFIGFILVDEFSGLYFDTLDTVYVFFVEPFDNILFSLLGRDLYFSRGLYYLSYIIAILYFYFAFGFVEIILQKPFAKEFLKQFSIRLVWLIPFILLAFFLGSFANPYYF